MHKPKPLTFSKFGLNDGLSLLPPSTQVQYIKEYLRDLGVQAVVEEPNYFDRDYLAEFSAFYAISSRGYPNICKRLHFFGAAIDREQFQKALGGDEHELNVLQGSYKGFCVIRPIPSAPLGRTVLALYPNTNLSRPRITDPARVYKTHLAGLEFTISGLAWQQQDTGVAACATVGVWTMLHSSAFDDHHAIPTTAEITKSAHKHASLGSRVFPSVGLSIYQLAEAIKENNLSPVICDGDVTKKNMAGRFFSRERFASTCAAFIRSGYPALIIGQLEGAGPHAQCAVGFRESQGISIPVPSVNLFDAGVEHIYIHDDNLGPNVRFKILEDPDGIVYLKTDSPPALYHRQREFAPTEDYPLIWPQQLIVAVHNDLRTSPDHLHRAGLRMAGLVASIITQLNNGVDQPLLVGTRFMLLTEYMGAELSRLLGANPDCLSRVRFALQEECPPMSLHVGLVRICLHDSTPLVDVLFDTTDSDRNHPAFAHLTFLEGAAQIVDEIIPSLVNQPKLSGIDFGAAVSAF